MIKHLIYRNILSIPWSFFTDLIKSFFQFFPRYCSASSTAKCLPVTFNLPLIFESPCTQLGQVVNTVTSLPLPTTFIMFSVLCWRKLFAIPGVESARVFRLLRNNLRQFLVVFRKVWKMFYPRRLF